MSRYIEKLVESLKALTGKGGSLVIPEKIYGGKVYPKPKFSDLNAVHIGDPDIRAAIDFIGDVAVGNGFETTMNKKYTTKSGGLTAKEIVDDKCKKFGMDELSQEFIRDLVGYGNSVIWHKNPVKIEVLARVLPGTIQSFDFDAETNLIFKGVKTLHKEFPADELIWMAYGRIGKTSIGVGILQSLCTALKTETGDRPPFAEIKNRVQKSMMEQIEKFSAYNELWVLGGIDDAKAKEYHTKIQALKNSRLVFNPKKEQTARVHQLVPERMRGLDFYAETLWNSFYLALNTPYPKLILGGGAGFTEAAANAAVKMGDTRISALRRYAKRVIETQIFDRWVIEEGLDPHAAQVRLNWQLVEKPNWDVLLPLLEKTWELKGISDSEWRGILINLGVSLQEKELPKTEQTDESSEARP